jgi:hypothetical protein
MSPPKGPSARTGKPKQHGHKKVRKRVKGQKGSGSGWGLFSIAVSITLAFAVSAFRLGKKRHAESTSEKASLRGMLLRPLLITDHAACRMDCRCAYRYQLTLWLAFRKLECMFMSHVSSLLGFPISNLLGFPNGHLAPFFTGPFSVH